MAKELNGRELKLKKSITLLPSHSTRARKLQAKMIEKLDENYSLSEILGVAINIGLQEIETKSPEQISKMASKIFS